MHLRAHAVDVGDERVHAHVVAQQGFVADDHARDIVVGTHFIYQCGDLVLVVLPAAVKVSSGHYGHAVFFREGWNHWIVQRIVRAQALGVLRQQLDVGLDFLDARVDLLDRALVALVRIIGQTADHAAPVGWPGGTIERRP